MKTHLMRQIEGFFSGDLRSMGRTWGSYHNGKCISVLYVNLIENLPGFDPFPAPTQTVGTAGLKQTRTRLFRNITSAYQIFK